MLHDLIALLSGALFCNCIPHLVAGLQGECFPTPFARPPGRGLSPAWVNFAWGFCNLAAATAMTLRRSAHLGELVDTLLIFAGAALAGGLLSLRFARVRAQRA